jgi:hypothetical protein
MCASAWPKLYHLLELMPGWRQRLANEDEQTAAPPRLTGTRTSGSYLCALLVEFWAFGLMSPQMLQRISEAALKDLDNSRKSERCLEKVRKDIADMAALGSGKNPGNCNRDLFRHLAPTSIYTYAFRMPLRVLGYVAGTPAVMFNQAMLLPHVLFSVMGNKYPKAFAKLMCPSRARLEQFWGNMARNPQLLCTMGLRTNTFRHARTH